MSREKVLCGKEEIFRVAIGIVDSDGMEALSVRNIAKELGVSPMTIYNYVENLNDIKKRVLINGFDRMYSTVYAKLSDLQAAVDKMLFCKTIAMSVYRFASENRGVFIFMFSDGERLFSEDAEIRPFYNNIQKLMKRAKATKKDWTINEKGYRLFEILIFSVSYQFAAGTKSLSEEEYGELIDYYLTRCIS